MSTGRLNEFARKLLEELNNDQLFNSLDTLPPVTLLTESKTSGSKKPISITEHPLVIIESQATLFEIKNTLLHLCKSEEELTEKSIAPLQAILTYRFEHRFDPRCCTGYAYGAKLTLTANDACIKIAKSLHEAFPQYGSDNTAAPSSIYAHRLVWPLSPALSKDFDFKNHRIIYTAASDGSFQALLDEEKPLLNETLTADETRYLYNILYTGMIDTEGLIERLFGCIPQNTWQLFISCLDKKDLLLLASNKSNHHTDKKEKEENITDGEYEQLELSVTKMIKNPQSCKASLLELLTNMETKLHNPASGMSLKENNDAWNRAIFFVIVSFYALLRDMLPTRVYNYTSSYMTSFFYEPGYTKEQKIAACNVLLAFLASNRPLSELESALKDYPAANEGKLGFIYSAIQQAAAKKPDNTKTTTTTATAATVATTQTSSWGWGLGKFMS